MARLIFDVSPPKTTSAWNQAPSDFLCSTPVHQALMSQVDVPVTTEMLQCSQFMSPVETGDTTMAIYCERVYGEKRRKVEIIQPSPTFQKVVRHAREEATRSATRSMEQRFAEMEADMAMMKAELATMPSMKAELATMPSMKAELATMPSMRAELAKMPSMRAELAKIPSMKAELAKIPGMEAELAKIPGMEAELSGLKVTQVRQFKFFTDNLALALARMLDRRMSKKDKDTATAKYNAKGKGKDKAMDKAKIKAKTTDDNNIEHDNVRLVRFASTLTAKDLAKYNIPAKYLKCLKGLDNHRSARNDGGHETQEPLAALLVSDAFINTPEFNFWSPLLEIVHGQTTEELAEEFKKHHIDEYS
ncbi:MAG: hypothetical protein M1838_004624 [Thelocarpon superellum]|nr:MAG: hypothetical protein M1838_004624 [Thelocarpon superellum]